MALWTSLVKSKPTPRRLEEQATVPTTKPMLEWIRDYNDELDEPNPDQKKLDDYAKSIQGAITQEERKITDIQAQIKDAVGALNQFHDDYKRYESTLQGDGETLKSLLEEEGNDIESLNAKIADEMADIATLQSEIDAGRRNRQKIKETAYYVWIAIAAVTVDILTEADIKRPKEKMESIQAMLDENQAKPKTAIRLSSDIQSMGTQVTDLLNVIGPAIETLEALQGAWAEMSADLTTLYDLFEDDKQTIPPMLLGERQLATIVDAWNDLKAYAGEYIQHAFMISDPEKITIQDYVKQLDDLTR